MFRQTLRFLVALILAFNLAACGSTPANQSAGDNNNGAIAKGDAKDGKDGKAGDNDAATDGNATNAAPEIETHIGTIKLEPIQTTALKFDDILRKNDRVLFVGDDVTQLQYFTRSLTSALLAYRPTDNLRFYNGGMNGATAESAGEWVGELMSITKPTVVFINFGLNDGQGKTLNDDLLLAYEKNLANLIKKAKAFDGVRQVVVLSAPAVQTGPGNDDNKGGYNQTLFKFALSAQTTAGLNGAKFVDLYEPMRVVYAEAAKIRGDGLSFGGRLPSEEASTIIASVVLWGIGVDAKEFNKIGWAPLKAPSMGRIRGALGLPTDMPNFTQSSNSRTLYEKLREHDEIFFIAWRLAGPKRTRDRGELKQRADDIWLKLDSLVRSMYVQ